VEEYITCILRVEEEAKQETSMKQAASSGCKFHAGFLAYSSSLMMEGIFL
jgi:hypothetical protein